MQSSIFIYGVGQFGLFWEKKNSCWLKPNEYNLQDKSHWLIEFLNFHLHFQWVLDEKNID